MKRNLNENSTRSTAGCLPVPLFNQKKRNRQPLTSNPLKNDSGISIASDSYDFPPLPTDWAWEALSPELPPLMKTVTTGQIPYSVSHPLKSQDTTSKSLQSNTERSQSGWSYRDGNKNDNLKTWDRNDFRSQCKSTNLVLTNGKSPCPMNLGAQQQKQLRLSEHPKLSQQREMEVLRQTHSSSMSGSTVRALDKNSALHSFKPNFQQNQFKKKMLDEIPKENSLKLFLIQLLHLAHILQRLFI
ncbi:spermatogenesis-associated protein 22 isoform X2 [Tamandua tetradactyla]|uniref:spermatogenesis-associated protein 22 isoform X2 n=1 Tax=Tamandua tetradactyla TaxID=48850 RepID=UPI0040543AD7